MTLKLPEITARALLSEFSMEDLCSLIDENPYLRGYLQGYLAELKLKEKLKKIPGVVSVTKIPDVEERKGDLLVEMDTGEEVTFESKCLSSSKYSEDVLLDSWQGRVTVKNPGRKSFEVPGVGEVMVTNLKRGQFDVLAICTYAMTGTWDFLFIENCFLPESDDLPGFLKTQVIINPRTTPCLIEDPNKVLTSALQRKTNSAFKINVTPQQLELIKT